MIKLTNTLSGTKEPFFAINEREKKVTMYNCGPTVYDFAHIGNLRSYVFADVLRKTLEFNGYSITQVINSTDIGHLASDADDGDDKMTKGLKREGKSFTLESMKELGDFYTERFKEDLTALNIQFPTHLPKASEHITEDIELITTLEKKGVTYTTSDGVYFDTSKDPDYGKLGNMNKQDENEEVSRIGINTEKRNPKDFALWKFNNNLGYESPWGKGFPGWHIECSAMSKKYLGQPFDIHTGGIDHIPVHHNNEIAQSETAFDKPYAHFWLHNAHVNIEGGKMAKSEGNFIRLQSLIEHDLDPLSYRYWLLGARYSTSMNFSWDALQAAQNAYSNFLQYFLDLGPESGTADENYVALFKGFINDDLDTPKALALAWELLKDEEVSAEDKRATLITFDKVLGLGLETLPSEYFKLDIPENVAALVEEREQARKNKDFKRSDELRSEIQKAGFEVKDTDKGPILSQI